MSRSTVTGRAATLTVALVICGLPAARAQVVLKPIASVDGKALYLAYCAQCHGADGRGTGIRAAGLSKPPADLTGISQRNGGKYATETVVQYIMGVRPGGKTEVNPATGKIVFMTPEGPADMPAWGVVFRQFWPDDMPRLRPTNLARYLQSIQRK